MLPVPVSKKKKTKARTTLYRPNIYVYPSMYDTYETRQLTTTAKLLIISHAITGSYPFIDANLNSYCR